jgi:hypothetical protein
MRRLAPVWAPGVTGKADRAIGFLIQRDGRLGDQHGGTRNPTIRIASGGAPGIGAAGVTVRQMGKSGFPG